MHLNLKTRKIWNIINLGPRKLFTYMQTESMIISYKKISHFRLWLVSPTQIGHCGEFLVTFQSLIPKLFLNWWFLITLPNLQYCEATCKAKFTGSWIKYWSTQLQYWSTDKFAAFHTKKQVNQTYFITVRTNSQSNLLVIFLKHCKLRTYIQYFDTLVEYFRVLQDASIVKMTCKTLLIIHFLPHRLAFVSNTYSSCVRSKSESEFFCQAWDQPETTSSRENVGI